MIVEDEKSIARYIEILCSRFLSGQLQHTYVFHSVRHARDFIENHGVDLCLLDLDVNGENGYDLLNFNGRHTFPTIIVSAHIQKAIDAFEYGVVDFVPKPFDDNRFEKAVDRFLSSCVNPQAHKRFLVSKQGAQNSLIDTQNISHFKAADIYVEAHLLDGKIELLSETMNCLEEKLPANFFRSHRSYIIDLNRVENYGYHGSGNYGVHLKGIEQVLPLSRSRHKALDAALSVLHGSC